MLSNTSGPALITKIRDHWKMEKIDSDNALIFSKINHESGKNVPLLERPVLFFNASTRLTRTSLNAAFAWLTAAGLQNSGIPVCFLVCHKGLNPCLLATDKENLSAELPCAECMRLSRQMYNGLNTIPLSFVPENALSNEVEGLEMDDLEAFTWQGVPLGELTLPSLRWIMRRHHLNGVPNSVQLHRRYIRSAWSVYEQTRTCICVIIQGGC